MEIEFECFQFFMNFYVVKSTCIFRLPILKQNPFLVFFLGTKHCNHMKVFQLLHIPRIMLEPVESRMLVLCGGYSEILLDH